MSLSFLASTWTAIDQTTSTFTDSLLGLFWELLLIRTGSWSGGVMTYLVLAKSEGHMLGITTNLDPN